MKLGKLILIGSLLGCLAVGCFAQSARGNGRWRSESPYHWQEGRARIDARVQNGIAIGTIDLRLSGWEYGSFNGPYQFDYQLTVKSLTVVGNQAWITATGVGWDSRDVIHITDNGRNGDLWGGTPLSSGNFTVTP